MVARMPRRPVLPNMLTLCHVPYVLSRCSGAKAPSATEVARVVLGVVLSSSVSTVGQGRIVDAIAVGIEKDRVRKREGEDLESALVADDWGERPVPIRAHDHVRVPRDQDVEA